MGLTEHRLKAMLRKPECYVLLSWNLLLFDA